ncbi:hypothetical protein D3C78_1291640 [compost metagenome]
MQHQQPVPQPGTFNKARAELGFFTAGQQFKHLTHRHTRRKAIGSSLKLGQFRLQAQQPREPLAIADQFVPHQQPLQGYPTGPCRQFENGFLLDRQWRIREAFNLLVAPKQQAQYQNNNNRNELQLSFLHQSAIVNSVGAKNHKVGAKGNAMIAQY